MRSQEVKAWLCISFNTTFVHSSFNTTLETDHYGPTHRSLLTGRKAELSDGMENLPAKSGSGHLNWQPGVASGFTRTTNLVAFA